MKKILLTNNSEIVKIYKNNFDKIYTDSPYVSDYFQEAIYLETLLDESFNETIKEIRKKGHEVNKEIINNFFPKYKNRNIELLNIKIEFTNIYINSLKLIKLIELFPHDEITIGITNNELYNYNSHEALEGIENRFVNVYYWIADIIKIKNIKLICQKVENNKLPLGHSTINSWFLRLIDLDKKVLIFNFLKKFGFIKKNNKKKIYLYKKNIILREIEPYLYDLGFVFVDMPIINFNYQNTDDAACYDGLKKILNKFS